jgi:hypothetical protein
MKPSIFNYWIASGTPTKKSINKAYDDLKNDIENGLLKGVEYVAELKLLESIK